jgi:type II secretory pathway pseudopilin PulG
MKNPHPIRRPQPSEEGYMLVAVIFLVALLTIALAVALPRIAKEIQRDREVETMHRGKQYIRGVRMYYKKFGAYPPNVDALVKGTNNIRFLRKKYADPTTGKEDWKPVRYGQNKAPTAMGFFGVPLGGSTIAGVGPSGGNNTAGNGLNPQTPTVDPNASPVDPNNPNATTPAAGQPGQTGQTFGGVGIIGFSPNSPKKSILIYKTKDHYNEWEFVYDPIAEQMMMQGGNTGLGGNNSLGGNNGIGGNNGTGGNNGIGGNTGIGGIGGNTGTGGNNGVGGNSGGNPTTPPTTPTTQ